VPGPRDGCVQPSQSAGPGGLVRRDAWLDGTVPRNFSANIGTAHIDLIDIIFVESGLIVIGGGFYEMLARVREIGASAHHWLDRRPPSVLWLD